MIKKCYYCYKNHKVIFNNLFKCYQSFCKEHKMYNLYFDNINEELKNKLITSQFQVEHPLENKSYNEYVKENF